MQIIFGENISISLIITQLALLLLWPLGGGKKNVCSIFSLTADSLSRKVTVSTRLPAVSHLAT